MNSIKCKEIFTKYLLSTVRVTFPEGSGIFQQDLARCHTSKMMQVKCFRVAWQFPRPQSDRKRVGNQKKVAKV